VVSSIYSIVLLGFSEPAKNISYNNPFKNGRPIFSTFFWQIHPIRKKSIEEITPSDHLGTVYALTLESTLFCMVFSAFAKTITGGPFV
jgi:hypothetical protein